MTNFKYLAVLAAFVLPASVALASDHRDGPRATDRPSADLTDLYVWWNDDRSRLNLILNAHPDASGDGWAATDVAYVVHLTGHGARGARPDAQANLACRFSDAQHLRCELGPLVAEGPVGSVLSSAGGELEIAAGLRTDPAVWNRRGYEATIATVHDGIFGGTIELEYDDGGCPLLAPVVSQLIQSGLSSDADGGPASNAYVGQRVLALEVSIAREHLPEGAVLGAWAASYDWQVAP